MMQETPHVVSATGKVRTQTSARPVYIVLQKTTYFSLQLNEERNGREIKIREGP